MSSTRHRNKTMRRFGAVLLLCLCASRPAAAGDGVVAQLGSTRYTAMDLRDYLATLDPGLRRQALADGQAMNRLIQLEIIRKAILAEALDRKWQQRPDVARKIAAARDAVLVKDYLAAAAGVPDSYPSPQEVQAAYDLNRDNFLVPRQYRLEQIFIASPRGDKNAAAALARANDIAAKAHAAGANFEALARTSSQHKPSAAKGGDMGWAEETRMLPEIRARIAGMIRGEISNPIRSDQGWHIVRMMDTRPAAPKPLAEVRAMLVTSLRQRRQQEEEQRYIVRLLQKTPVTLNTAQLRIALAGSQ